MRWIGLLVCVVLGFGVSALEASVVKGIRAGMARGGFMRMLTPVAVEQRGYSRFPMAGLRMFSTEGYVPPAAEKTQQKQDVFDVEAEIKELEEIDERQRTNCISTVEKASHYDLARVMDKMRLYMQVVPYYFKRYEKDLQTGDLDESHVWDMISYNFNSNPLKMDGWYDLGIEFWNLRAEYAALGLSLDEQKSLDNFGEDVQEFRVRIFGKDEEVENER